MSGHSYSRRLRGLAWLVVVLLGGGVFGAILPGPVGVAGALALGAAVGWFAKPWTLLGCMDRWEVIVAGETHDFMRFATRRGAERWASKVRATGFDHGVYVNVSVRRR